MSSAHASMLMDMGFSKEKVEKALQATGNAGVEPAMEWLLAHAEELDQQESIQSQQLTLNPPSSNDNVTVKAEEPPNAETGNSSTDVAKSIKCEECGKLFQSQLEIEYHAAKSGHENFSESTEEKKALTEEEKQEQLRVLEQKIKEKRKDREEKEKLEALEREKNRIRSGKEMVLAKKKLEDEEIRKAVEQRKREKEEDRMARQRVKDQIEADRLARKAKQSGEMIPTLPTSPVPAAKPPPQKDYSETKLQIRLTNGKSLVQSFGTKEQLSAVRLFIEMNRSDGQGSFNLMTNFPKKIFEEDDYDKPLDVLGLVPSAVIIVAKVAAPPQPKADDDY